jgi:hypothetical protein
MKIRFCIQTSTEKSRREVRLENNTGLKDRGLHIKENLEDESYKQSLEAVPLFTNNRPWRLRTKGSVKKYSVYSDPKGPGWYCNNRSKYPDP